MRAPLLPVLLLALLAPGRAYAQGEDDPLAAHRARFREGLDRYEHGDVAGAIVVWEPLYATLGPERGYRLSFDLGRAYDVYGDALRAAEYFDAYVREVERRRAFEPVPENVEAQAAEARARLDTLGRALARIEVEAPSDSLLQVDAGVKTAVRPVLYLAPGPHTLTFSRGAARDTRRIELAAGERSHVEVALRDAPPPPPAAPAPVPSPPLHTVHPVPIAVPIVLGGVALASAVAPTVFYARAFGVRDAYLGSSDPVERARLRSDYGDARTTAYVALAGTATLAAAALVLTGIYALGARREASVTVGTRGGDLVVRF